MSHPQIKSSDTSQIPLQPASKDIWTRKYQLITKQGQVVDETVDDTFKRVAHALAQVEVPERREEIEEQFLWALRFGALPAGRIISNAGAQEQKPNTSLINCTVSATIEDSMPGILQGVKEAGITLSAGCGIGYEFSTLRPRNAFVAGVGAYTSGAVSFMGIYNSMCFTVASAGGRRGAQMGTLDVSHPDVRDFIKAKRDDGVLRQFNLSLLITDEFMRAVEKDGEWKLTFPINRREIEQNPEVVWKDWPLVQDYMITNDAGEVCCKVYETLPARQLWNAIMVATYDYAEPGFILIDAYNQMNNLWWCENIRATNPCGEQGLPPYGSCLLGSINLTKFVNNPFTPEASFDWDTYKEVTAIFCRMLDNVVELNGLPLEQQRVEIETKRRHGMGYLGLGSTLTMLRMKYGTAEACVFTEKVSRVMAVTGWEEAVHLAREKGEAPIMAQEFEITNQMIDKAQLQYQHILRKMKNDNKKATGRYLFTLSRYMDRIFNEKAELLYQVQEYGVRYSHHSSIAPTGTISLSIANNASNGIEPSFSHHYVRNVIREGRNAKEAVDVYSFELLAYRHLIDPNVTQDNLPSYFTKADEVTPKQHVDMQAAAQFWIDSSISKTANVPTDIPFEEFKDIYMYAWRKGLKGCTTFRFNPAAFQGVLVNKKDLENTTYQFKLENGETIEVKGNELVEYAGQAQTAANLFDSLKEGYFGKL